MRIGELAKRSGLSRDTLRFYERQGLIGSRPEAPGVNTYRDYPDETLMTLDMVAEAQDAGFTIAELVLFFGRLSAPEDGFDGGAFLDAKIAEVEARLDRGRRFLATLKQARAALEMAARGPER